MKAILLTLTSLLLALSAHAQGTVEFANDAATAVSNILTGAPVPAGNTFLVQLYYGPAGMTSDAGMISVTDAPIGFVLPGIFSGGTRSTILPGGTTGSFQVRAWEASLGATWETAWPVYLSGSGGSAGMPGKSIIFQMTVANPLTVPPQPPTSLVTSGFKGFYVGVPEPGNLALGALGMAALLWRRRKTS